MQDSCRIKDIDQSNTKLIVLLNDMLKYSKYEKDKISCAHDIQMTLQHSINVIVNLETNIILNDIFNKRLALINVTRPCEYIDKSKYTKLVLLNKYYKTYIFNIYIYIGLQESNAYNGIYYNDELFIIPQFTALKILCSIESLTLEDKDKVIKDFVIVNNYGGILYSNTTTTQITKINAYYAMIYYTKLYASLSYFPTDCYECIIYNPNKSVAFHLLDIVQLLSETRGGTFTTIYENLFPIMDILPHIEVIFNYFKKHKITMLNENETMKKLYDIFQSLLPFNTKLLEKKENIAKLILTITCNMERYITNPFELT
jgi:hypothetical protein